VLHILLMNVFIADSDVLSEKKTTSKVPATEAFRSGSRQEEELDSRGGVYDDTTRLLEKGGTSLKWGEVFQMFKRQPFLVEVEDRDEFKIFKNIKRLGLHRVASCAVVFSCANTI